MRIKTIVALLVGLALASVRPVVAKQPPKSLADRLRVGNRQPFRSWALRRGIAARAARSRLRRGEKLHNRVSRRRGKTRPLPKPGERTRTTQSRCPCRPYFTAIHAARQATKTIPIVMVTNADPVAGKLVDSLARPGGNITGLSTLAQDLSGKRLELLTEVVPRLSRVAVLRDVDSQHRRLRLKSTRLRHAL